MNRIIIKLNSEIIETSLFENRDKLDIWYQVNKHRFHIDHTVEIQDLAESKDALKYLAETDYLVIRKAETGVDYPQSIKDARAAARLKVIK